MCILLLLNVLGRIIIVTYIESNLCYHQEIEWESKEEKEGHTHGAVSFKTYFNYFKAGGGFVFTIIVLALLVLSEVKYLL